MKFKMGEAVLDSLTGFSGVVTAFADYITGCKQFFVQPRVDKDGKFQEGHWFDESRLEEDKYASRVSAAESKAKVGGPQENPPPVR